MPEYNIKTTLFTILCICSIFYLFMGIFTYKRDKKSRINIIFFVLCISSSLWSIGQTLMLISPNIEIANISRIVGALGWCFFNAIWISFIVSISDIKQKKSKLGKQYLLYIISLMFFISNLGYKPSKVVRSSGYGFVDNLDMSTFSGHIYIVYSSSLYLISIIIMYLQMKNCKKNRVRKQMKVILITTSISICLALISDLILPLLGIKVFPAGSITLCFGMVGMWYAINKHKMMLISNRFVSEYIFETVSEPIFILGEDFLVKNYNKALLDITGYNYKELEQNKLDAIINFRGFNFSNLFDVGNISNIEVDLHRKDKHPLVCELSATIIYDEYNDILGIGILLHDVSERKNIAEIQMKMIDENKKLLQQTIEYDRLKTEFFANISHEFRTPLNVILSIIQLLNFTHKDSIDNYDKFNVTFEKYIGIMKQNSYRLLKLINNIIDLTKIDTGFSEINLNNHNIVEVVEDITISIADYIESKGIKLVFDTEFEERIIACDDEKIERIMLNLLSNAIKHTKSGGTINVNIKEMDTNVLISVQDTGIGIPSEKLDVIFERFRQVDELLTRRAEGSGIGLALVKSLVESHGGTINVSSTYGVGSEFVILLPSRIVEQPEKLDMPLDIINNADQLQKKIESISIEFSDI